MQCAPPRIATSLNCRCEYRPPGPLRMKVGIAVPNAMRADPNISLPKTGELSGNSCLEWIHSHVVLLRALPKTWDLSGSSCLKCNHIHVTFFVRSRILLKRYHFCFKFVLQMDFRGIALAGTLESINIPIGMHRLSGECGICCSALELL